MLNVAMFNSMARDLDLVHVGARVPRQMRAKLKALVALRDTTVEELLRRLIESEISKQPTTVEGTPS
jgi:hypothetical protein